MRLLGRWSLAALFAALVVAAAGAAAAGDDEVGMTYVKRLTLPFTGESIQQPKCVTADLHTGELFACDTRRQRIEIFDDRQHFRYEIRTEPELRTPLDVAVDPEGYLFVVGRVEGRGAISRLDFDGAFLGRLELTGLPDDALAPDLGSLALSPDGSTLYTLDLANRRIWIAGRDGRVIQAVDVLDGVEHDEKLQREFVFGHVDVYGDTLLVALTSAGWIRLYALDGTPRGHIGLKGTSGCQIAFPVASALDVNGDVWVLDKQRVLFMRWRPDGNRCLGEYSGIGNSPGALYQPDDLTLDARGRIYVSQGYEGRVQVYEGAPPAAMPAGATADAP